LPSLWTGVRKMNRRLLGLVGIPLILGGLVSCERRRNVQDLIVVLETAPDPATRGKAADSLGEMGPAAAEAVPALIAALSDCGTYPVSFNVQDHVCCRACEALRKVRGPEMGKALGEAMLRDERARQVDLVNLDQRSVLGSERDVKAHLDATFLLSPRHHVYGHFGTLLSDLGPEARPALPDLIRFVALIDPGSPCDDAVLQTIDRMQIGADSRAILPEVLVMLRVRTCEGRPFEWGLQLVERMHAGPESREVLPDLLGLLRISKDPEMVKWGLATVRRMDVAPGSIEAKRVAAVLKRFTKPAPAEFVERGVPGGAFDQVILDAAAALLREIEAEAGTPAEPPPSKAAEPPPPAVAPFDAAQAAKHQRAWADYLGVPVVEVNSVGMELVLIPPGEFEMGTAEEQLVSLRESASFQPVLDWLSAESPRHRVRITRPFYLGIYEVTRTQFVEGRWPDSPAPGGAAVYTPLLTAWTTAQEFCRELSEMPAERAAGREYRLPTEAEWEYACRAGTTSWYSFGDDASRISEYASWGLASDNWRRGMHPVGLHRPNAWGLYDVHGNAGEWCGDWFAPDYYGQSPSEDPAGPSSGTARVTRGGGGSDQDLNQFRSAYRHAAPPERSNHFGFRVAMTLPFPR
jgi:formylglycine-generating enzyme required for sulfatase activity